MKRDARIESRLGNIAAKHIKPQHIDRALGHYAKSLRGALDSGRMSKDEVDNLTDEHHDAAFARIAKDNKEIAAPAPPPPKRSW
jgi:hypothetical protein